MEDIILKNKIVEVEVDKIKAHEGSHKTEVTEDMLKKSLADFGITQPITIDKDYNVVTGNAVFKAAKSLGMKTIPCIILDHLNEEQVKQYRIADDKTSSFATWNQKKLRQELSYLQDPKSVQEYFDENIFDMLGLNDKPRQEPKPVQQPQKVIEQDKVERDNKFKEELRQVDQGMNVRPAEYIEYHCSKCGRLVKVKSN